MYEKNSHKSNLHVYGPDHMLQSVRVYGMELETNSNRSEQIQFSMGMNVGRLPQPPQVVLY